MSSSQPNDRSPVGMLAGWGEYPLVIARALRRQGRPLVCIGVKDHADPRLPELCDHYIQLGMGKVGAAQRYFRRHGVRTAMMAGKIHKVLLFQRCFILKHLPDWEGVCTFFPHFASKTKDRKDDTLLGALATALSQAGIQLAPPTDFVPELLVKTGNLTKRRLSRSEARDVEFGWRIAKEIGRVDIGQSVAVKGRAVLAVEAVEGTDQCIRRAGDLCRAGGFTVVKVAKPSQDMRFDVPTIGMGTIESLVAAGGRVLAIEADKTILINQPEVIDLANRHAICIVAIEAGDAEQFADAA